MTTTPPPINEQVVDENNVATLPWVLFFNQNFIGDTGTEWTPTFTSLGATGTPTITGRYYKLSQELTVFNITITPDTDTTSTAGTTFCDNFPLAVTNSGFCVGVGGTLGLGTGIVSVANAGIYTPAWTSVTVPVNIIGLVEAK